jgi:NADH-quinone oxidoreductase subunit M
VVLLFGVWPDPIVSVMNTSVDNLVQHIAVSKL